MGGDGLGSETEKTDISGTWHSARLRRRRRETNGIGKPDTRRACLLCPQPPAAAGCARRGGQGLAAAGILTAGTQRIRANPRHGQSCPAGHRCSWDPTGRAQKIRVCVHAHASKAIPYRTHSRCPPHGVAPARLVHRPQSTPGQMRSCQRMQAISQACRRPGALLPLLPPHPLVPPAPPRQRASTQPSSASGPHQAPAPLPAQISSRGPTTASDGSRPPQVSPAALRTRARCARAINSSSSKLSSQRPSTTSACHTAPRPHKPQPANPRRLLGACRTPS